MGVGGVQRIGDLGSERQQHSNLQRAPGDAIAERQPVQKLHGDEGFAALPADVVNGANIGMIQRGGGLSLELKSRQRVRVSGNLFRQELEGHEAMQPRVLSFVHHAHTATTQFLEDAVVRDGSSDHVCVIIFANHWSKNPTSAARASQ